MPLECRVLDVIRTREFKLGKQLKLNIVIWYLTTF